MVIRQANSKDARRISYLIKKNTGKVLENNYTSEQVITWKKANSPKAIAESLKQRIIFCAFQNDKLVGTIGLQENEVVGLYVSYAKRGKGIGRQLLSFIESYAKAKDIKDLELTSTPSAVKFYAKSGYQLQDPVIVKISGVEFKETRMTKKLK